MVRSGVSLEEYVKTVQEAKDNDLGGAFNFVDDEDEEDTTLSKGYYHFSIQFTSIFHLINTVLRIYSEIC